MRDLRHGVKLKKVQERQYNPLPIEYQLTPYEMLMDDIRSKRYKLRKVMVRVFGVFFVFVLCVVQRQAMVLFCSVTFHFFFLSRLHVTFNVFSQVNGDIPPRLKKSAHEVILEFIRSRPPLNPVSRAEHGVSN